MPTDPEIDAFREDLEKMVEKARREIHSDMKERASVLTATVDQLAAEQDARRERLWLWLDLLAIAAGLAAGLLLEYWMRSRA